MPNKALVLVLLLLASSLLAGRANSACSKPLKIGMSDWERNVQGKAALGGFDFDQRLFDGIMEEAGCAYSLEIMPAKRLQQAVRLGRIDGAISASKTPERQAYAYFTNPYRREIMALFMRREVVAATPLGSVADLAASNLSIGLAAGAWYGPAFQTQIETDPAFQDRLLYSTDVEAMFQWLRVKRVDTIVGDLHFGLHMVRLFDFADFVDVHPFAVNDNDIHIMLSRKAVAESDVAVLNQAIDAYKASPSYTAVMEHFEQGYSHFVTRTEHPDS